MKIYGYVLDGKVIINPSKKELAKYTDDKKIAIYKGHIHNMVFENWWTDIKKQTVLDFCYPLKNNEETVPIDTRRKDFFLNHNTKSVALRSYVLPPECFTEEGVILPNEQSSNW